MVLSKQCLRLLLLKNQTLTLLNLKGTALPHQQRYCFYIIKIIKSIIVRDTHLQQLHQLFKTLLKPLSTNLTFLSTRIIQWQILKHIVQLSHPYAYYKGIILIDLEPPSMMIHFLKVVVELIKEFKFDIFFLYAFLLDNLQNFVYSN